MHVEGMRTLTALLALAAVPLFGQGRPTTPGPPGAAPPATATVNVDCAAGGTLSDALTTPAGQLTVVFTGTCVEDVAIRRGDVTLRGGAPGATIDGSTPAANHALLVEGGLRVTLSDFAVRNSQGHGLTVSFSTVDAANLTISDNVLAGVLVDGCTLRFTNGTVSRNLSGIVASGGNAFVRLGGTVVIADNTQDGLYSGEGAYVFQSSAVGSNLTVSGSEYGITVESNGQFHVFRDGLTVRQNDFGIVGNRGAIIDVAMLTLTANGHGVLLIDSSLRAGGSLTNNTVAAIEAQRGSQVELHRGRVTTTTVTGNRVGISADAHSQIMLSDTTVTGNVERDVRLAFGATLSRYQNATVGTLACDGTELIRPPATCAATFAMTPAPDMALRRAAREERSRVRERE